MGERYVDPNSGAAPQPGGYASAPVQDEGQFDAAVADEVTEAQESEEAEQKEPRKSTARVGTKGRRSSSK